MSIFKKISKTKPTMLFTWMFSAFVFGIGLGAYFSNYLQPYALGILLAGLIIHLYTMGKIYTVK